MQSFKWWKLQVIRNNRSKYRWVISSSIVFEIFRWVFSYLGCYSNKHIKINAFDVAHDLCQIVNLLKYTTKAKKLGACTLTPLVCHFIEPNDIGSRESVSMRWQILKTIKETIAVFKCFQIDVLAFKFLRLPKNADKNGTNIRILQIHPFSTLSQKNYNKIYCM